MKYDYFYPQIIRNQIFLLIKTNLMKKRTGVVLASIAAVCLLLVGLSKWINWPVDNNQASGNISKTSRYSKKVIEEASNNMQELLLNDEEFKNSIVLAYSVMESRAKQFNTLVELSSEVAKDLPPFAELLADMQAAKPLIENVCAQMKDAGEDLSATLDGESRSSLAQNTNNAALAYGSLQKQNNLAERFVETADAWLAQNEGSDQLKLVRDRWLEYLQLTAAITKGQEAAKWDNTAATLTAEQASSALNALPIDLATNLIEGSLLSCIFMPDTPALPFSHEALSSTITTSLQQDVNASFLSTGLAQTGDLLNIFQGAEALNVLQGSDITNAIQNVGPAIEAMEAGINIANANPKKKRIEP